VCGNLIGGWGTWRKSIDNFMMRCSGRLSVLDGFLSKRSKRGELKVSVRTTIITIVVVILIPMSELAWPAMYYVDPDGNDNNNGSLRLPFATIQRAINKAAGGKPSNYDLIHVAKGTYVTGPIVFNNNNQRIFFEKGVLVLAKSNKNPANPNRFVSYRHRLFVAGGKSNIILSGYGATFRMRKSEYGKYLVDNNGQKHGIGLFSCDNIEIRGLTIEKTGGDGIFVGSKGPDYRICSKNILIKDVTFTDVMRNGMQIASVNGLTIEDCIFEDNPNIGISFEPDRNFQRLDNIVVRNTTIRNGGGSGVVVALKKLKSDFTAPKFDPYDVSFVFENMDIINCGNIGISITRIFEDGPGGYIKFKNVTVDGTRSFGASVYKKSSLKAYVSFESCIWKNIGSGAKNQIIGIASSYDDGIWSPGGVEFVNCQVFDDQNRPAISTYGAIKKGGKDLYEVHGDLYVENDKYKRRLCDWGSAKLHNVDLTLHAGIADFFKEQVKP
jgi:hypothetical protein